MHDGPVHSRAPARRPILSPDLWGTPSNHSYGAHVPVVPVLTAHVLISLWFAASLTVSVTFRVPAEPYLWLTVTPLPVVPSPNVQAYDEMPLSSVEVEALKLQVLPFLALQFHVNLATGGALTGAAFVVAVAVFEKPDDPPAFFASTRYAYVVLAARPVFEKLVTFAPRSITANVANASVDRCSSKPVSSEELSAQARSIRWWSTVAAVRSDGAAGGDGGGGGGPALMNAV